MNVDPAFDDWQASPVPVTFVVIGGLLRLISGSLKLAVLATVPQ